MSLANRAAKVNRYAGLKAMLERLGGTGNGTWTNCRCPAHDDANASFGWRMRDNGKITLKCHAGCSADAIRNALGSFEVRDLYPPKPSKDGQPKVVELGPVIARYVYEDENGEPLYRVNRHSSKTFRQQRHIGRGFYK